MKKRLFAILLSALLLCGCLCGAVRAEDGVSYIDAQGKEQTTPTAPAAIASDTDEWSGWMIAAGKTVLYGNVTLTADTDLILADGASLTVVGSLAAADGGDSLQAPVLRIYGQTKGSGMLDVIGMSGASLFSDNKDAGVACDLIVAGGTVNIVGGISGKIGGTSAGGTGMHGDLTVTGGTVTVTGGRGYSVFREENQTPGTGGIGLQGNLTASGTAKVTVKGGDGGDKDGFSYTDTGVGGTGGVGAVLFALRVSDSAEVTVIGGAGGNPSSLMKGNGGNGLQSGAVTFTGGTATFTGGEGGDDLGGYFGHESKNGKGCLASLPTDAVIQVSDDGRTYRTYEQKTTFNETSKFFSVRLLEDGAVTSSGKTEPEAGMSDTGKLILVAAASVVIGFGAGICVSILTKKKKAE